MSDSKAYLLNPHEQGITSGSIAQVNPKAWEAIAGLFDLDDAQEKAGELTSLPHVEIITVDGAYIAREIDVTDVLVSAPNGSVGLRDPASTQFGLYAIGRVLRSDMATGMGDGSDCDPAMVLDCCRPDGTLIDQTVGLSIGKNALGAVIVVSNLSLLGDKTIFDPMEYLRIENSRHSS